MSILPQAKTEIKPNVSDLTVLVYGIPKIGKSTFCSHAENALFIATEPGLNHLEVYQAPVTSWEELLQVLAEIAKGEHSFKTIIIDTIDNMYKFCTEYVCKKNGIDHESDLGYGKAYSLIKNEFQRVLTKLAFLPYGLFMISHSQIQEIETRIGKFNKTVPTLPNGARAIVLGLADMILYCDSESHRQEDNTIIERRIIKTKPNPMYEAGDRTGKLPETLPLDYSTFVNYFTTTHQEAN